MRISHVLSVLALAILCLFLTAYNAIMDQDPDYRAALERGTYGYARQDVPAIVARHKSEESDMLRNLERTLDEQLAATNIERVAPMTLVGPEPIQTPDGPTMGMVMETEIRSNQQQVVIQIAIGAKHVGPIPTRGTGYSRLSRVGPFSRGREIRNLLRAQGIAFEPIQKDDARSLALSALSECKPASPIQQELLECLRALPISSLSCFTEVSSRLALLMWHQNDRSSAEKLLSAAIQGKKAMLEHEPGLNNDTALAPLLAAQHVIQQDSEAMDMLAKIDRLDRVNGYLAAARFGKESNKSGRLYSWLMQAADCVDLPSSCAKYDHNWLTIRSIAELAQRHASGREVISKLCERFQSDDQLVLEGNKEPQQACSARACILLLARENQAAEACTQPLLLAHSIADPFLLLAPAREARAAGNAALADTLLREATLLLDTRRRTEDATGLDPDADLRFETSIGYAELADQIARKGDTRRAASLLQDQCPIEVRTMGLMQIAHLEAKAGRAAQADTLIELALSEESRIDIAMNRVAVLMFALAASAEGNHDTSVPTYRRSGLAALNKLNSLFAQHDTSALTTTISGIGRSVWREIPRQIWPQAVFESLHPANQCRVLLLCCEQSL